MRDHGEKPVRMVGVKLLHWKVQQIVSPFLLLDKLKSEFLTASQRLNRR